MAFEIATSILINSSSEKIWDKLVDFGNYSDWNPFIKSIVGEVEKGNKIHVEVQGMSFKPIVTAFDMNERLQWKGVLIASFLFEGTHLFEIQDHGNNTCTFKHSEKFKGVLLPLLKRKLSTETKPAFEAMNQSLKNEMEKHP